MRHPNVRILALFVFIPLLFPFISHFICIQIFVLVHLQMQ